MPLISTYVKQQNYVYIFSITPNMSCSSIWLRLLCFPFGVHNEPDFQSKVISFHYTDSTLQTYPVFSSLKPRDRLGAKSQLVRQLKQANLTLLSRLYRIENWVEDHSASINEQFVHFPLCPLRKALAVASCSWFRNELKG